MRRTDHEASRQGKPSCDSNRLDNSTGEHVSQRQRVEDEHGDGSNLGDDSERQGSQTSDLKAFALQQRHRVLERCAA